MSAKHERMMNEAAACIRDGDIVGALAALDYRSTPKGKRGRRDKYGWATLEVGEPGFHIDGRNLASVRAHAAQAGKRYGRRFRCIADDEGVYVERVA